MKDLYGLNGARGLSAQERVISGFRNEKEVVSIRKFKISYTFKFIKPLFNLFKITKPSKSIRILL